MPGLQQKIERYKKQNPVLVMKALDQGTQIVEREVKRRMPSRTSDLRDSVERKVTLTPLRATIGVNSKRFAHPTAGAKAAVLERGKTIFAKRADYLHFPIGGKWVKVKSVTIPKQPSFGPAWKSNRKRVQKMIVDKLIRGWHAK